MSAFNDIRSTAERIAFLKGIIAQINSSIQHCRIAQKFFDTESAADNYGEYIDMWDGVKARLNEASAAALLAAGDLDDFITKDGFVFKYQWIIGKKGVSSFTFTTATDKVVIGAGGATQDSSGDVLGADFLLISGTTSNNGLFSVLSSSGNEIVFNENMTDETCTNAGARIVLVARLA